MKDIFKTIKTKLILTSPKKIIFPEYNDERVLRAANRLSTEKVITPVFIGKEEAILAAAEKYNLQLSRYEVINPETFSKLDELTKIYVERRQGRIDLETARTNLQDPNYFAALLVHADIADGLVSGAIQTTSTAALPALQIIKPREEMHKVSGAYLLVRGDEQYIFADCAININPTSEELAEITLQSAETAELLAIDPKVAMLSFSTKGSAHSPEVDKIVEAVQIVKDINPTLAVDGEVQFDAAYMPTLATKKSPDLTINGDANVFVFPNLEAGNISCKIAERLGGFQAVGPMMQGLNRPVNLLSRGCSEDDIYKVALLTAMQANALDESTKRLSR